MADVAGVGNRCSIIENRTTREACEAAPAECNGSTTEEPEIYRGTTGQCGRVEDLLRQIRRAKDSARLWSQCMMVKPEERLRHQRTSASCSPGTATDVGVLRRDLRALLSGMERISK